MLITPFGAGLCDSISRRRDDQLHIASGGHDLFKQAACSSRIGITQFAILRPSRQYFLDRTNAVDPGWRGPEHVRPFSTSRTTYVARRHAVPS